MKKITYLFVLCLLVSASYAAPAPVLHRPMTISGEPEPHPYNIVLKMKFNGSTLYLQWVVFPETTIEELRGIVSDITNDPDVHMRYNGVELFDGFTLADYGIGPNAIISCS